MHRGTNLSAPRRKSRKVQTSLLKRQPRTSVLPSKHADRTTTRQTERNVPPQSADSGNRSISARELLRVVSELSPLTPLYRQVHAKSTKGKWFTNEREHLMGWLSEYDGPGAYARMNPGRDAKFFYNHFNDPYGLSWLAEALGVQGELVQQGIDAVEAASPRGSAKSGAFRKVVLWSEIEPLVLERLRH